MFNSNQQSTVINPSTISKSNHQLTTCPLRAAYCLYQMRYPHRHISYDEFIHASNRRDNLDECARALLHLENQSLKSELALAILKQSLQNIGHQKLASKIYPSNEVTDHRSLKQLDNLLERINNEGETQPISASIQQQQQSYEELLKNIDRLSTEDSSVTEMSIEPELLPDLEEESSLFQYRPPTSRKARLVFNMAEKASALVDSFLNRVMNAFFKKV